MDPTPPRVPLASRHSLGIELLKIIQRQQRERDEHPSPQSFASQCLGILADRAGGADVATLPSRGALEDGEGSAFPHPPCNQGEKTRSCQRQADSLPSAFPAMGDRGQGWS